MTLNGLPDVHVVGAPLGTVDGVTVAIVTAEVWYDHLAIRIAPVVDRPLESALSTWSREVAERRAQTHLQQRDEPPPHPVESILQRVLVDVTDSEGNLYRRISGLVGGTDTELRAEWHYHPVPGRTVRTLIVSAQGVDDPRRTIIELK